MEAQIKEVKKHFRVLCKEIGERHLGSKGEKKAADYIKKHFTRAGYEVFEEYFEVPGWEYSNYELEIIENKQKLECFPCFYSNSCDVKGELFIIRERDLNNIDSLDVEGKICFVDIPTDVGEGVYQRNRIAEILDKLGASVMIITSNYYSHYNTKLVRVPDLEKIGVIVVSGKTAYKIAKNKNKTFRVKIVANKFTTKSCNVIAKINKENRKKIIIGAHYDTAPGTCGANDNASGTVVLLELARILKDRIENISLEFVAFTGEELGITQRGGGGTGSYKYVQKHKGELKDIILMCNIDDVSNLLGEVKAYFTGDSRIKKKIERILNKYRIPIVAVPKENMGSDASVFAKRDVSTINFNNFLYQHILIHTPDDSLYKIDFERTTALCNIIAEMIEGIQ